MRAILAQVLEDQGYSVTAVDRGETAVQSAQEATFDLIVADIRMEGMSGLDAVAQTKQHHPEIGTIIVSGFATPEETTRARQLQVGGFLKKPFKMKDFLELVSQELATRSRLEQHQERGLSAREALLWAFSSLGRVAGTQPFPEGHLEKADRLAESLCRKLRLTPEVEHETRAACSLVLLEKVNPIPEALLADKGFLSTLKSAITHYQDRWDEDPKPPMEARVVALVVAAFDQVELPNPGELGERDPGYLDPELLKIYQGLSLEPDGERPEQTTQRSQEARSLLALARTLERVNDSEGALKAYTSVAQFAAGLREGVEALLGKARLSQPEPAAEFALEAAKMAQRMGPVASATTSLEAGLILISPLPPKSSRGLNVGRNRFGTFRIFGSRGFGSRSSRASRPGPANRNAGPFCWRPCSTPATPARSNPPPPG